MAATPCFRRRSSLLRISAALAGLAQAAGLAVPSQQAAQEEAAAKAAVIASVPAQATSPHLVRLRREVYPVRRKGKIVSFKASYSGVIHVGHPTPQEFRVVFDTGSGHVILPSIECRTETCVKHRRYDISKSVTAVPVNMDGSTVHHETDTTCDQVTIGFGTGQVTGEFARDKICLGPVPSPSDNLAGVAGRTPCVDAQLVMAISMSKRPFELFEFDGIMGLGLRSLALSKNFSFFGLLSETRHLGAAYFAVFLADADTEEESEIAIGGVNPARLLSPLSWAPMNKPELGYWQVEIFALHIGDRKVDLCSPGPCSGILDTGTSHLGVPASHSDQVYELLSRDAGDLTDCRASNAPVVKIELRHFNLTLYPENYMRKLPLPEDVNVEVSLNTTSQERAAAADARALAAASQQGSDRNASGIRSYCTPKLLPVNLSQPIGPNVFILGEPVLHRYYTVYDWGGLRAGFGVAQHMNRPRAAGLALPGGDGGALPLTTLKDQDSRENEMPVMDDVILVQMVVMVKPVRSWRTYK
mmetsp:Transcript_65527/g.185857  ORF Transcript_65527/g.185857 Transcript_65527/m.185857 type:complete len:529 (-) Transcript_65527:157-1743(-)